MNLIFVQFQKLTFIVSVALFILKMLFHLLCQMTRWHQIKFVYLCRLSISINSLSIDVRVGKGKSKDTSLTALLSNVAKCNLRKLDLNMICNEINSIIWPIQCTLQSLTFGLHVTLKQFCTILSHLSQLWTLTLRNCTVNFTYI
jgi:hypothetical protein